MLPSGNWRAEKKQSGYERGKRGRGEGVYEKPRRMPTAGEAGTVKHTDIDIVNRRNAVAHARTLCVLPQQFNWPKYFSKLIE